MNDVINRQLFFRNKQLYVVVATSDFILKIKFICIQTFMEILLNYG